MTASPDDRQKRLRALGLLILPLFTVTVLIAFPIARIFAEQGERLHIAEARLSAFEKRRAEIPHLEARVAAMERQPAASQGLFSDNSASLVSASIQGRVRPILISHGAEPRSIQNLPPVSEERFERVPVQYVLSLPPAALRDFLYDLETSSPYLFIEELSIRAADQRAASPSEPSSSPLEIRMTISGYRWTGDND
jgi:hypothetical protein